MLSRTKLTAVVLYVAALSAAGRAADDVKYYRLEFTVKELEADKVTNTRSYATAVSTAESAGVFNIRTGNKVPIPTGSGTGANNYTYVDVGVNIDCRQIKDLQDQVALTIDADISSAAAQPSSMPPLIRQTRWRSNVVVTLRKPTIVFSADDPTTKRQTQLELTATPVK